MVEALVALAVMSFGMLALVGVQATMRLNSDVAKQRGEATRIATEEIERLRGFGTIAVVANELAYASYDSMADGTPAYASAGGIGNTTYTIARTVITAAESRHKSIAVRVNWTDRSNQLQSVTLETAISATDPALAGLLAILPTGSATNQRSGRHASIPPLALDQGNGRSRFIPPGSTGVSWLFNNLTGLLQVCNSAGEACSLAHSVSGTVQFHRPTVSVALTASNSENPQGPALNLADSPAALTLVTAVPTGMDARCYATRYSSAELAARKSVDYFCAIQPYQANGWGGRLNLERLQDELGTLTYFRTDLTSPSDLQVCRYTLDLPSVDDPGTAGVDESTSDPNAQYTLNADHPMSYCIEAPGALVDGCKGRRVKENLINQNFLVMAGSQTCPTDVVANPSAGDRVNSNTRPHQP
jgi:Tfp pilus assembly protein PilV